MELNNDEIRRYSLKSKSQAFRSANSNGWFGQFGVCFDVLTNIRQLRLDGHVNVVGLKE